MYLTLVLTIFALRILLNKEKKIFIAITEGVLHVLVLEL